MRVAYLHLIALTLLTATLLTTPRAALAVQPDEILTDPTLEGRARTLSKELRCMVCQNQSIDDSDATLARDLRLLIRERLKAGDSDGKVIAFVVDRYGEFVLLKPRFEAKTIALWTGPFVRPVPGAANSAFGTRSIFNGVPRNAHGGADFLSPGGTPIHAPNDCRIVVARSLYFSGNTVVIDHGLGLFSMLAHLSAIDVQEGGRVTAGQVIGQVGATGRVTGPHLHWAVRAGGARVDPLSLLALLGN